MVNFDRVRTRRAIGLTRSISPKILGGSEKVKNQNQLYDVLGARVVAT